MYVATWLICALVINTIHINRKELLKKTMQNKYISFFKCVQLFVLYTGIKEMFCLKVMLSPFPKQIIFSVQGGVGGLSGFKAGLDESKPLSDNQ